MNKLLPITAICALPLGLAALPPARVDPELEAAYMLPGGCLGYVEVRGFSEICQVGLAHPVVKAALATPLGELARREAGMPLPFALGALNAWVGRPVLPSLAELTEGGLSVGVLDSGSDLPTACVVARGDAAAWDEVLEYAMRRVASEEDLPESRFVAPHRKIRGMDVWLLGDYGAIALSGGLFLGATDEDTLRHMLDLGAARGEGGLARVEGFTQAQAAHHSKDAFGWSWVDLAGAEAAWPEAIAEVRKLPAEPAALDLFGPRLTRLGSARAGVFELRLGPGRMDVDLLGLDLPLAPETTPAPVEGSGDLGTSTHLARDLELVEPGLTRPSPRDLRASIGIVFGAGE